MTLAVREKSFVFHGVRDCHCSGIDGQESPVGLGSFVGRFGSAYGLFQPVFKAVLAASSDSKPLYLLLQAFYGFAGIPGGVTRVDDPNTRHSISGLSLGLLDRWVGHVVVASAARCQTGGNTLVGTVQHGYLAMV
jgi:hypothetical protein